MEKQTNKGWLYLLPALLFLGIFMVYPLIDVFIYSFEEGYTSASQTFTAWAATTIPMSCTTDTSCRH